MFNMMKLIFYGYIILLLMDCSSEEIRMSELKKLNSGTDSERIESCIYFGKEKSDKIIVSEVGNVIKTSENKNVVLSCIQSLGFIGEGGVAVTALKDKIFSTSDSDIVHTALYSIYAIAIKQGIETHSRDALRFSDVHHRKDKHTADLVDKINLYFKEKEK